MNRSKQPLNIAVIGGGAAGMMAAISAARNGAKVTLYEKNEKLGKKIYITGKGRCNVTNGAQPEEFFQNIVKNRKFLYSAFYAMTNEDVVGLLTEQGLALKTERGNRIFPVSDRSQDVIDTLKQMLRRAGVKIVCHTKVKDFMLQDKTGSGDPADQSITGLVFEDDTTRHFERVIIATGGVSYPVTGSDGQGMQLLSQYGHHVTKLRPALVPMNVSDECVKEMQGLSLKNVKVSFFVEGKKKSVYEDFGEMLFTHFGVSGPVILSASSMIGNRLGEEKVVMKIDLKPALTNQQLDERIRRDFSECKNKDFRNSLDKLLPKSLIPVIIDRSGIDPYKKVNEIEKAERFRLLSTMKEFELNVTSLRGFQEAIITSGGIDVKEINPKTMESKRIKNLYVAGEMLDVDALTGGFNLQIAWSTGWLAGLCASEEKTE